MTGIGTPLERIFNSAAFDVRRCAHVAIDVQERFLNREEDEILRPIAGHLVHNVAPAFNRLGIPTYWVWYGHPYDRLDLHRGIKASPIDTIVRKETVSAMASGNLKAYLDDRDIAILFVSGFYAPACVLHTILDAAPRYKAILMTDCTDPLRPPELECFTNHGTPLVRSDDVLRGLRALKSG